MGLNTPIIIDVVWFEDPVEGWILVANLSTPNRKDYQEWMKNEGTEEGPQKDAEGQDKTGGLGSS